MSKNPRVFLDVTIGGVQQDRIEIDLYADEVPLTAENFRVLCTNEKPFSFKDSTFYRIIPGFMCKGGDFNGTRFGASIYGEMFPDVEVSARRHRAFDLTTALGVPRIPRKHAGPYPYFCGSLFYICVAACPCFDDDHVVFGTVVGGRSRNTVLNMNKVGSPGSTTSQVVKIVDCGQIW